MRSLYDIASEYCGWVDRTATIPNPSEWLPCILAELVHAAFSIPRDESGDDASGDDASGDDESSDAGAEDYQRRAYKEVRAALPELPFHRYREVFDALDMESEEEVVIGTPYDDLADIYLDLAEGLHIHHHDSPAEAMRYWSQSFESHWGEHATSALRAFYCSLRHRDDDE